MPGFIKAKITPEASGKPTMELGESIPCMFNPDRVTIKKQNKWDNSQSNENDAPRLKFTRGEAGTFNFPKIIFDTTDRKPDDQNRSVSVLTDKLLALMKVDKDKHRPPWVKFQWGPIASYLAVIKSIQIEYTYFATDGTPLRAEVDISLEQFKDENDRTPQNPTSLTPVPDRSHQVVLGETLESIAFKHYGQTSRWRAIAAANSIQDPLSVEPGTRLRIPRLEAMPRG